MRRVLVHSLVLTVTLVSCTADQSPVSNDGSAAADSRPVAQPADVLVLGNDALTGPQDADSGEISDAAPEVVGPFQAEPTPCSLVDMYAFQPCPDDADPWFADASQKALDARCSNAAWGGETFDDVASFDVATSGCAYVTVRQPLRLALAKGDRVRVALFYTLITAGVAPYVLAVGLGDPGAEVWRTEVTFIPATQQLVDGSFTADRDYAVGEWVYFHVSNHGTNIWALTALEASMEGPEEGQMVCSRP